MATNFEEKVNIFLSEIKDIVDREDFSFDKPFRTYDDRQKVMEIMKELASNPVMFDSFVEKVNSLDDTYRDKIKLLFESIPTTELASISYLNMPMALITHAKTGFTSTIVGFGSSNIGKTYSLSAIFQGINGNFIGFLHNAYIQGDVEKGRRILEGWTNQVLDKVSEVLGVKIDKGKFNKVLAESIKNWFDANQEKTKLVDAVQKFATAPLYNDIKFINIFTANTDVIRPSGKKEIFRQMPNYPIAIMDDSIASTIDSAIYHQFINFLTDSGSPTAFVVTNNNVDSTVLENFNNFFLKQDNLFGRLGLVYHVVGSPDDYSKYKQYDFSDIENIGRKFAIENTNILLLDLALRDLMGDDTVKPIIEGMKTSLGEENADRFQSAFKTLKNHLSYMLQIAYRDKFPKTHRPTFSTTPLFYEYEDKTGQKKYLISPQTRREMISDFINKLWGILENPKSREAIINRALNGINSSFILEALYHLFYNNREKFSELEKTINSLKEFHVNLGSIYGDKFTGLLGEDIKTGKTVDETSKEGLKEFAFMFNNEDIRKKVENISIDPELAGKKRIDEIWKFMRDNAKKLTSHESIKNAFETTKKNFESGSTKKEDYMRVYDKVVKPFREAGQSGQKVNVFLAESFEGITSEKGFNEVRAYEIIRNMNRVRMCRLKGDTVKVEERANRFINVFNSVVTALKEFIPDPDDYKKVATMFTLATFGLNPLSKHILKQIGVMEDIRVMSLTELKKKIIDDFSGIDPIKDLDKWAEKFVETVSLYRDALEHGGIEKKISEFITELFEESITKTIKNLVGEKGDDKNIVNKDILGFTNLLYPLYDRDIREKAIEKLKNFVKGLDEKKATDLRDFIDSMQRIADKYDEVGIEAFIGNQDRMKQMLEDIREYLCRGKSEGGNVFVKNFADGIKSISTKSVKTALDSNRFSDAWATSMILSTLGKLVE